MTHPTFYVFLDIVEKIRLVINNQFSTAVLSDI